MTKEEKREYNKKYNFEHKEERREHNKQYNKQYRLEHKEETKQYNKQYRLEHKEETKEYDKKYKEEHKEERNEYGKKYSKKYNLEHKEEKNEYINEYYKNRKKTDPAFKTLCILRSRLSKIVANKCGNTMELSGCSLKHLLLHLEQQFQEGMNWENQGEWHIDHIKPCASFNLDNEEEQKQCFHYTNLQPLWAEDNLRKGSRIV